MSAHGFGRRAVQQVIGRTGASPVLVRRDVPVGLVRGLDLLERPSPRPAGRPQPVPFANRLPRAGTSRQVMPLHSGPNPVQNPVRSPDGVHAVGRNARCRPAGTAAAAPPGVPRITPPHAPVNAPDTEQPHDPQERFQQSITATTYRHATTATTTSATKTISAQPSAPAAPAIPAQPNHFACPARWAASWYPLSSYQPRSVMAAPSSPMTRPSHPRTRRRGLPGAPGQGRARPAAGR